MLTKTQLKILAYLIDNQARLLGIRELAREISSVYYLVQKNVQQLREKNVIIIEKAGRTSIVKLHQMIDANYLVEAERFKRELFYKKYPSIRIIFKKMIEQSKSSFFILLVFGSYAKKLERKDSDLDILAIVQYEDQIDEIERIISSVARTSPIKIHHMALSESSFISMLQKKELNVAIEVRDKHILIYGDELYYKLLR